jgi:hypothetical protein
MKRLALLAALAALAAGSIANSAAGAQSLAQRIGAGGGNVQIVYPSRPSACGDGRSYIGHVFGQSTFYSGNSTFSGHGSWETRPCEHGPARLALTMIDGEVTRMRAYVGPVPASDARTINASAAEVTAWLSDLISHSPARLAKDAMFPLMLVDAADPWPFLLRIARDENRPLEVRRGAIQWLGTGVSDKLGIADEGADTDDDEMRKQAVFVLSQRPKSESVPELMSLARSAKYPSVRRQAIFWLGQTGDVRAADVYAELLKLR